MNDYLKFKAFDEGGMDGLLRQTMEGHRIEPKPGLWKTISRKLLWREIAHLNFKNISTRFWAAGTAGLLVITTALYLILPPASNPVLPSATSSGPHVTPATTTSKPNPDSIVFSSTNSYPIASTAHLNDERPSAFHSGKNLHSSNVSQTSPNKANPTIESTAKQFAFLNNKNDKSSLTFSRKTDPFSENTSPLIAEQTGNSLQVAPIGLSRLLPIESALLWIPPADDTIISITTPDGILKYKKESLTVVRFFSANLGIEPEMTFYSEPDVYSKLNFWINGRLTYHISRFSVATGLGLGYVFDEGKYRIDYQSLDSVGYFTSVISYTTGSNNEIYYNTETKNVYDSLRHMADDRTRNRYAYLQIPFLLGYQFFESNSVSFTFQVGPAVSFLIDSHESSPVINYPNARIIKVEDDTPARINTNWQLWANLNLEIRLNRKISLFLEPSFKYFLKPMVEQENVSFKAPWSIGLGVGFQINFGKK